MAKTGDGESLGTAEGAVLGRATHALHAENPVLRDSWAPLLLGPKSRAEALDPEHEPRTRAASGFDFRLILAVGIGSLRYAEDEVERAVEGGTAQYVILGAGFDTFALRREDMKDRLRVYEVDFPDVQQLKRSRIEQAGETPAQLPRFVPVDFETMSLSEGLAASDFDPAAESIWSWMNTLPYLTREATESTLREISSQMAPGSRLVLNYQAEVPLSEAQVDYLKTVAASTRAGGEPWQSRWETEAFEALIADCGLRIVDRATEDDLNRRYFAGRADRMYAAVPARLLTAEKTG